MKREKWKIILSARKYKGPLSLNGHRDRIAATETERNNSAMRIATFQLVEHRGQET
jgi:hypothetical protein